MLVGASSENWLLERLRLLLTCVRQTQSIGIRAMVSFLLWAAKALLGNTSGLLRAVISSHSVRRTAPYLVRDRPRVKYIRKSNVELRQDGLVTAFAYLGSVQNALISPSTPGFDDSAFNAFQGEPQDLEHVEIGEVRPILMRIRPFNQKKASSFQDVFLTARPESSLSNFKDYLPLNVSYEIFNWKLLGSAQVQVEIESEGISERRDEFRGEAIHDFFEPLLPNESMALESICEQPARGAVLTSPSFMENVRGLSKRDVAAAFRSLLEDLARGHVSLRHQACFSDITICELRVTV